MVTKMYELIIYNTTLKCL